MRTADTEAAQVIMGGLSSFCVKQVLPVILQGLDEHKWRSKVGSVEMLGTMAYLAPKQLAISLPLILPKLTEALNDSHANVQKAAR